MSVYDDNEILKDMLLVHEALEEVEEISSGFLKNAAAKARKSEGKHREAADKFREIKDTSYSDKKRQDYNIMQKAATVLAEKRARQEKKFEKGASDKEMKAANDEYMNNRGALLSGYDKRYTRPVFRGKLRLHESFEDIYNSIL